MNNAKIWLVVKPTVGVPIFLSAVAIGSFAVHVAVLSNTTWVSDFLSGQELGSSAEAALDTDANVKTAGYQLDTDALIDGSVVTLPDGRTARLVVEQKVALADPGSGVRADLD
jgi:light-harvesting protein B-800-850 alpha chain